MIACTSLLKVPCVRLGVGDPGALSLNRNGRVVMTTALASSFLRSFAILASLAPSSASISRTPNRSVTSCGTARSSGLRIRSSPNTDVSAATFKLSNGPSELLSVKQWEDGVAAVSVSATSVADVWTRWRYRRARSCLSSPSDRILLTGTGVGSKLV